MIRAWFIQFRFTILIVGIALLTIGTATGVWKYKSAMEAKAIQAAVDKTNKEAQRKIDEAEKLTALYRDLADAKYGALMEKLSNIKVQRTQITNNIREEVIANPEFYNQPLPPKGWDQWIRARNLYPASPATPSPAK